MQVDYIRKEVNEAISENGGAYIQLVNKNTVGLAESIKEAITNLYINGQESTVKSYFTGLMQSMFAGIKADGHPRSLGGLITIYPVCGGTFDLNKGWDPLVNDVRIKARLLNEVEIDVTNWSLHDVTPGKVAFTIESVAGGALGVITRGVSVDMNGKNFPEHDKLRVSWVCGDKSGEAAGTTFGSTVTRITIDPSALSAIASTAYDGKDITFIVRGCYNMAKITGVYKYVDVVIAETPDQKCQVTAFKDGESESEFNLANEWKAEGKGFYATSVEGEWMIEDVSVTINGTRVSFTYTPSTDHTKCAFVKNSGEVAAGTYENQVCKIALSKGAETHEFEIPLARVVVA